MKRFRQTEFWEAEKIKGSRFLVMTCPVTSFEEVQQALSIVRLSHPNANHNCWAFRLSNGVERCSDDGEPSGSAGGPILQRLVHAEVVDSLAIVTRYFGGTKLGMGGLIRAYGRSVAEALNHISMDELVVLERWKIQCSYSDQSLLRGIIYHFDGQFYRELYMDNVEWVILLSCKHSQNFVERCVQITSGRVIPENLGRLMVPLED